MMMTLENPDSRKLLQQLISEYGNSLERGQAEKELQRAMEARAVCECGTPAKAFKTVAMAYWKDQTRQITEELETLLALLDQVKEAE